VKKEDLTRLYDSGILSDLDMHFASFIGRLAGTCVPELLLAAAIVSSYTRQGHICLDLSRLEGKQLLEGEDGRDPVVCPKLGAWLKKLRESPVVGKPGEYKPLILDDRSGLYLYRYWDYQQELANLIRRRVSEGACPPPARQSQSLADSRSPSGEAMARWGGLRRGGREENIDEILLKEGLERLFGTGKTEDLDWQKVAAFTSVVKRFCVISGGPGTGKTTTVAKILVLIIEQASPRKLRIALAAPTGKAAARLQEAIKCAKGEVNCPESIKEAIPEEASTIHRLLGSIPESPYFRHNAQNRLPVDVVVVDEASMVDLALMSKLIQALPLQARMILLGDKDQLASVEAGAVLGDICDTGNVHSFSRGFRETVKKVTGYKIRTQLNGEAELGIQDCIVQLQKSFRFGSDSGIGAVSRAVNAGDDDLAVTLLREGKYGDIKWRDLPQPTGLPLAMQDMVVREFADYLQTGDIREIFQLFDRFRILCALRKGPYGVINLNALVEQILTEEGLIDAGKSWYPGRPILITSNDYNLRLFNGDVGIVLPDCAANNDLRVFVPGADGTVRKFHPLRLPEHETVYAMTVHKSQGSEFNRVFLLLPDKDFPLLTRELAYTGITRAKEGVEIWGNEDVFRAAVCRRIERMSGLRDALWES
jgi:exodeoxyribonuclease V alpha subunit